MPPEYAFEIDSNVGRYWLAHGEGFDVVVAEHGKRIGIVEDVVLNPFTREVSSVVVRRPHAAGVRRPAEVAIDELTAVLPASRRFVVMPDVPALTGHARRDRFRARMHGGTNRLRARWWAVRRQTTGTARGASHAVAATGQEMRARWPAVRHALATGFGWTRRGAVVTVRATSQAVIAATAAVGRGVFAILVAAMVGVSWAVRAARERA